MAGLHAGQAYFAFICMYDDKDERYLVHLHTCTMGRLDYIRFSYHHAGLVQHRFSYHHAGPVQPDICRGGKGAQPAAWVRTALARTPQSSLALWSTGCSAQGRGRRSTSSAPPQWDLVWASCTCQTQDALSVVHRQLDMLQREFRPADSLWCLGISN